jgi:hypothetical protein
MMLVGLIGKEPDTSGVGYVRISGTLNGHKLHRMIIRCYGYHNKVVIDLLHKSISTVTKRQQIHCGYVLLVHIGKLH